MRKRLTFVVLASLTTACGDDTSNPATSADDSGSPSEASPAPTSDAGPADARGDSPSSKYAVGWTDLPNTKLKSVCPPNLTYCEPLIGAWSGGIADTSQDRLILWGGGHGDYPGNELYSLNLDSAPVTLTRLNNPSPVNPDPTMCPTALSDGNPNARHTYNGLAYLPTLNEMLAFGGALACGSGAHYEDLWTLDLASLKWTRKDPVNGAAGTQPRDFYTPVPSSTIFDPGSGLVFISDVTQLWSYDPSTNTYAYLNPSATVPDNGTPVLDTKRETIVFMGSDTWGGPPRVSAIDVSAGSSYAVQDWTSKVTGCDALARANDPGLAYDDVHDRIVGWPNFGNTVYVFDPKTKTCTAETFAGGPADSTDYNGAPYSTGTFGRFRYFPALDVFALVNFWDNDAFVLKLPPAP